MEILGIGPQELLFIIIIALIILGPKDMQKAGKTIGTWLNRIIHSDGWKLFQQTSKELQQLPTKLMREANLEEFNKELQDALPSTSKYGNWARPSVPTAQTVLNSPPPPTAGEAAPEVSPADPPAESKDGDQEANA